MNRLIIYMIIVTMLLISGYRVNGQNENAPDVYKMQWSENGSRLIVVTREHITSYDDALNQIVRYSFPPEAGFSMPYFSLSPDGKLLHANGEIWSTDTLLPMVTLQDQMVLPSPTQWSSDSSQLALRSSSDQATLIFDVTDGRLLKTLTGAYWQVGSDYTPIWSPNNQHFVTLRSSTGIYADTLILLDASNGSVVSEYILEVDSIRSFEWAPDSRRIALVTSTTVEAGFPNSFTDPNNPNLHTLEKLIIIDITTEQILTEINGVIGHLTWSRLSEQLAGSDYSNGIITVWNAATGAVVDRFAIQLSSLRMLQFSPYGGRLGIGTNTGTSINHGGFGTIAASAYHEVYLNGLLQFVVPAPSESHLAAIIDLCNLPARTEATLDQQAATDLTAFTAQVAALPDTQITPGCRADLLAVAAALQAQ
jgi:WD40 repeat protein